MHKTASFVTRTISSVFSISILCIFFTYYISFFIYSSDPIVNATPVSLCLPVLPTLCRQISTSMSKSLSVLFGTITLITKVAFLISMPLAIIFVQSKTLIQECLNLKIISSLSLCGKSTFIPSLYTFAAIVAFDTCSKNFVSYFVKSVAQESKSLLKSQMSSMLLKKTKICGVLPQIFSQRFLKTTFKTKSKIEALSSSTFFAFGIAQAQLLTPKRVIFSPVSFSISEFKFNLVQSGKISSQNFKKCFYIVAEQAIIFVYYFLAIFSILPNDSLSKLQISSISSMAMYLQLSSFKFPLSCRFKKDFEMQIMISPNVWPSLFKTPTLKSNFLTPLCSPQAWKLIKYQFSCLWSRKF